jgi:Zn-dependent protease
VLVHELAHSLVARAHGIRVCSITLFMLGGVSNFEREPTAPRVEFLSAIVGPITSFLLGVMFHVLARLAAGGEELASLARDAPRLGPASTILGWLAFTNVMLAIFNMVPGFPLDGGRVLRSLLWASTRDLRKATRLAARVGQAIAWAFVVTGAAMAFGARVPILGTGLVGGLWLAFIGWFLNGAATQSYQQVELQAVLAGVKVRQLMRTTGPWVTPETTVNRLVYDWLMASDAQIVPVVDQGRLVGAVTVEQVQHVGRDEWHVVPVGRIMTPADKLEVVSPDDEMAAVLARVAQDPGELPVVEHGRLVGLLYRHDVARWLELQAGVSRGVWGAVGRKPAAR